MRLDSSISCLGHNKRDLCKHIWFRRTLLLIYLLSLAVGADVIYILPYRQNTYFLRFGLHILVAQYAIWVSLNLIIVGLFVFLTFRMQDIEPGEGRLKLPWMQWCTGRAYITSLNVSVFILCGVSVAWDVSRYYGHWD